MTPRARKFLAGGATAAILVAAIGGTALAQAPAPTGTPRPTPQQRADQFIGAVAAKLGKSADEVKAAIKAVEKDRVAAELAAGRINQDQANKLNQRIDQGAGLGLGMRGPGPMMGPGPKGPGPRGPGMPGPAGMFAERGALAQFLGLTPQELGEQIRSGKSLAEVAQGKGKSRDDLKTFLTNQAKTRFSAAVTAGRLTQAQADQMLAKMTANLDTMIDHKGQPGKGPRPGQNQGPARQRGTSA